jgi:hypothetical protein
MGPETFFTDQLEMLEGFLTDAERAAQVVRIDPEMRRLPLRYFSARDEDDRWPHLLFMHEAPFHSAQAWFAGLNSMLHSEIATWSEDLQAEGVGTTAPGTRFDRAHKPWEIWIDLSAHLANSLPDHVGSLVFLIEPESVADATLWNQAVRFLADYTRSPRVKYVIFEPRLKPALDDAIEHPRVGDQLFWLSPCEIEKRAERVLIASQTGRLQ